MAARKTPSAGSKPDKLMRDALMLELNTETVDDAGKKIKKFRRIAANLVSAAMDNKMDAIKDVFDRIDGRPAQSVGIGQADDLDPVEVNHGLRPVLTRDAWLKLHGGE